MFFSKSPGIEKFRTPARLELRFSPAPLATPDSRLYCIAMEEESIRARLREHFSAVGHQEGFSPGKEGLVAVYLFGSFGRGTAQALSDVDLGILYDVVSPATLVSSATRLEGELEALLGRSVQVVVLNTAPVDLVHRVLRDGELLYESDRSRRIRFEVAARREHLDLLPVLRRYRRAGASG